MVPTGRASSTSAASSASRSAASILLGEGQTIAGLLQVVKLSLMGGVDEVIVAMLRRGEGESSPPLAVKEALPWGARRRHRLLLWQCLAVVTAAAPRVAEVLGRRLLRRPTLAGMLAAEVLGRRLLRWWPLAAVAVAATREAAMPVAAMLRR